MVENYLIKAGVLELLTIFSSPGTPNPLSANHFPIASGSLTNTWNLRVQRGNLFITGVIGYSLVGLEPKKPLLFPYLLRIFRQCPQNTYEGNRTVVSSYQATQFNNIISVVPLQYNVLILPDLFIQIGIQNSIFFYPPTVVYSCIYS